MQDLLVFIDLRLDFLYTAQANGKQANKCHCKKSHHTDNTSVAETRTLLTHIEPQSLTHEMVKVLLNIVHT